MRKGWIVVALVVIAAGSTSLWAGGEAAAAVDGKALYAKKCATCHGADGVAKPMAKGSANLNDAAWQKAATDDAIANVIVHGKNKMPKSASLTPEEVKALVAYVRTLK